MDTHNNVQMTRYDAKRKKNGVYRKKSGVDRKSNKGNCQL